MPDFFSQIGPFLRSMLPVPGRAGTKLPKLKPWVRVAFSAYILLIIPLLGLFLFLLFAFLPERLLLVWDTFTNQARAFAAAIVRGNTFEIAASFLQMLVLGLFLAGISLVVLRLLSGWVMALLRWSAPTATRRAVGAVSAIAAVSVVALLWLPQLPYTAWAWTVPAGPDGTQSYEVSERAHLTRPVAYAQIPPVGGDHFPIWQNCGFYGAPILNENGVHSMEHGAVWITYRPDLASEQVSALRNMARRQSHVLVSPNSDLPSLVVASAWGKQLQLESTSDPRLDEFLRAFRLGRQAPEPGERCDGGVGEPE
jgi:hypothetical protein